MPIETDFSFAQEPAAAHLAATTDLLGLLRGFVGHHPAQKPQRTWKGAGFNMIWRPNFQNQSGTRDFFLELNFTEETLSFIDITGTRHRQPRAPSNANLSRWRFLPADDQ
jgi:hypothetical protein